MAYQITSWTAVFVDGENLVARYQAMVADGRKPLSGLNHEPDVYVWSHRIQYGIQNLTLRAYYYAALGGDQDRRDRMHDQIRNLRCGTFDGGGISFHPRLFHKAKSEVKAKGVDIQMCTDLLSHVHRDHVDRVLLVSGDGDYLPLVEEVVHSGKQVDVAALSSGLNPALRRHADVFIDLDQRFFES